MSDTTRRICALAAFLCMAAAGAGCNQVFGLNETELSPRRAYSCECSCNGGGQTFDVNSNVCLPPELNPALNPDLPDDFQAPAADLQADCHIRVERNLERMAHQCVSNRVQCTCDAIADLDFSFGDCDAPCTGENLAADCSNFNPQAGNVTATNVAGEKPVCVANGGGDRPAAFASAIFGRTSECEVSGEVTVTRDDDSQTKQTTGVTSFTGAPCPGGQCAVGVSYLLDHVDSFSFSGFGGFASVEFKDIAASGASGAAAATIDQDGVGELPPTRIRNTGKGKRSNQVLGGETSSSTAAYTGSNGAPLGVVVDWTDHACALGGAVLGSVEDSDTAVEVDLAGTIVNEPPAASAAATPRTVECTSPAGATVTLDGSATSDPENNLALFTWRRGSRAGTEVGGASVVQVPQPLGTTSPYFLQVVDTRAQASEDHTSVSVVDSTPPRITQLTATPATIWPPNHKMVPISLTATSSDVCGAAACRIVSVASNEPVNGHGDGNTGPDWQITGPSTVDLRAERAGGGSRIYTLTVRCSDPSGNAATDTVNVAVAH
jgi:hypothetical protein